jgi:hypothetical protein
MRKLTCAGLAAALVVAGAAAAPAAAADLDYTGQAAWFSCGEPWASQAERPPTRGRWYFTEPLAPTVNFILPCHASARLQRGTPAWLDYCQRRWPSFNPRTGYVITPDGPRRCI